MTAKRKRLVSIAAVMVLWVIDVPAVLASGWAVQTLSKTNGDFATTSDSFVIVPGTEISFSTNLAGPAVLSVSGTEIPDCIANSQIGVRLDGQDYPLASNDIHTFAGGVAVFRIGLGGTTFVNPLPVGPHTASVILRRPDGTCGSARVAASTVLPLNLVIQHPTVVLGSIPTLSTLGTLILIGGLLTAGLYQLRQRRNARST